MTFDVTPESYDRFMGRFSTRLAPVFLDHVAVTPGQVLDVGCGPGALTSELVQRLGASAVTAVDPSPPFVAAVAERLPGVRVRAAVAEALPFTDDRFDTSLAQLVVHFMSDPVAGLREMRRVTRPGGTVGACVWDHAGGAGPLAAFWQAVRELDPSASGEDDLPGTREGHLGLLFAEAGFSDTQESALRVAVEFGDVDAWWAPFTFGVGPAGAYVAGLDDAGRDAVRRRCAELLPPPPFEVTATAWCATGSA